MNDLSEIDALVDAARREQGQREQALAELHDRIGDLESRRRLIRNLEMADGDDASFVDSIRLRMAELRTEQTDAEAVRRDVLLRVESQANPDLLHCLPVGVLSLDRPETLLRELFDLSHLEIHYDSSDRTATYICTLTDETIAPMNAWALKDLAEYETGLACALCCAVPFLIGAGLVGGSIWTGIRNLAPRLCLLPSPARHAEPQPARQRLCRW